MKKKNNTPRTNSNLFSSGMILSLLIVLASYIIGGFFYPHMPDLMASHWDINGQVNGYIPKFWGVILMPVISTVLFILFLILPKIDPKKQNIEKFKKYFDAFIVMVFLFLMYINILTLYWNAGYTFDMNRFIAPPFAILFYYVGILLQNAGMNWTVGIRTPWTMSSPKVWDKTHKRGAKLFKICALLTLLGILLPDYTVWFILVPIISVSTYLTVYSYVLFRKEQKGNRHSRK
jgi:uncharacterized membrane protein